MSDAMNQMTASELRGKHYHKCLLMAQFAKSSWCRQVALCDFILESHGMARQLARALDFRSDHRLDSKELEEACDDMEQCIINHMEKLLGVEFPPRLERWGEG